VGKVTAWFKDKIRWKKQEFKLPIGLETKIKDFSIQHPELNPLQIKTEKKDLCFFEMCLTYDFPTSVKMQKKNLFSVPLPSGIEYKTYTLKFPSGINDDKVKEENAKSNKQAAEDKKNRYKLCHGSQEAFKASCKTVSVTVVDSITQVKTTMELQVNEKQFAENEADFIAALAKKTRVT